MHSKFNINLNNNKNYIGEILDNSIMSIPSTLEKNNYNSLGKTSNMFIPRKLNKLIIILNLKNNRIKNLNPNFEIFINEKNKGANLIDFERNIFNFITGDINNLLLSKEFENISYFTDIIDLPSVVDITKKNLKIEKNIDYVIKLPDLNIRNFILNSRGVSNLKSKIIKKLNITDKKLLLNHKYKIDLNTNFFCTKINYNSTKLNRTNSDILKTLEFFYKKETQPILSTNILNLFKNSIKIENY